MEGGQVDRATVVGRWSVVRWIERQWWGGGFYRRLQNLCFATELGLAIVL